jgi:hypothetical protein
MLTAQEGGPAHLPAEIRPHGPFSRRERTTHLPPWDARTIGRPRKERILLRKGMRDYRGSIWATVPSWNWARRNTSAT